MNILRLCKKLIVIILTGMFQFSNGQVSITNPDFEMYNTCPTFLGQVANSVAWVDVIQSSDFYNCGLTTAPYLSNSTAYSGNGFMGFASYGDAAGSAEAIGQSLVYQLVPNRSYLLSFAAKKTSSGIYSDTCGGVALYGFKNIPPLGGTGIHVSQLPNAVFLGVSSIVQDSVWRLFNITFSPADTIHFLVFTVQHAPLCQECIFLDDLKFGFIESISDTDPDNSVSVYPNPGNGIFTVSSKMDVDEITVYDLLGQPVYYDKPIDRNISFSLSQSGIYFIYTRSGEKINIKKIIVTE